MKSLFFSRELLAQHTEAAPALHGYALGWNVGPALSPLGKMPPGPIISEQPAFTDLQNGKRSTYP
jgi:hypothetical protein